VSEAARRAAERAARESYGRLLALLARRAGDIAAAEDGLAHAFAAALTTWPERGVPDRPEAWLLTAARRALGHQWRAARVRDAGRETIEMLHAEASGRGEAAWPDERLALLFVCAHPAIAPEARTPLMLQTVLGLDAGRIAGAFLVAPATMGQRLVRAKAKIKTAGLRFAVPGPEVLAERADDVLAAIYAAYGAGWDALTEVEAGADAGARGLASEAIFLGRLMADQLPDLPEAKGLLALMLHCEARRAARRTPEGAFVPLDRQDTALWDRALLLEAEALLTEAAAAGVFGRFQCEAAIQSVHAGRAVTGYTDWRALDTLYAMLERHAPSLGTAVARAAVMAELGRAEEGLARLDALPPDRVGAYQPYWVTRAHLLRRLGRAHAEALSRAAGLTEDPAVRAFLLGR
jgi:RNA polymerase sigma-70 factor, ECF subfamily